MAETLRYLVVALPPDAINFPRKMRTINQQIREAEFTFRLAGVDNFEKTIEVKDRLSERFTPPIHPLILIVRHIKRCFCLSGTVYVCSNWLW